jgi:thymine-DNA glycosylase
MDRTMEEELNEDLNLHSSSDPVPATFKGRLNLSSYAFSPKLDASHAAIRRSPRVLKSEPDIEQPHPRLPTAIKSESESETRSPRSTPKRKSSTHLTPSSSPRKKSRSPSGYAPVRNISLCSISQAPYFIDREHVHAPGSLPAPFPSKKYIANSL